MKPVITSFIFIAVGLFAAGAHAQDKGQAKPVVINVTKSEISGFKDEQGKIITQKEFTSYIQTGNYVAVRKADGAGKYFLQLSWHPKPEVKPVYIKP